MNMSDLQQAYRRSGIPQRDIIASDRIWDALETCHARVLLQTPKIIVDVGLYGEYSLPALLYLRDNNAFCLYTSGSAQAISDVRTHFIEFLGAIGIHRNADSETLAIYATTIGEVRRAMQYRIGNLSLFHKDMPPEKSPYMAHARQFIVQALRKDRAHAKRRSWSRRRRVDYEASEFDVLMVQAAFIVRGDCSYTGIREALYSHP